MRYIATLSLLLTASFSSNSADQEWYSITSSGNGNSIYSIKNNSIRRESDAHGEAATAVVGQRVDKNSNQIELYKWKITDKDCENEYGSLVIQSITGKQITEAPFALGSNSVASSIADIICTMYLLNKLKEH